MAETSSISAFILAGGASRRMGRDKATLEFRGQPLIDHMAGLLSHAFGAVRIVGRGDLSDRIPGLGPIGGIATALEATETERNLVVAVDLPLLTPEFLKLFKTRIEGSAKHVVACRIESEYPLCLGIDRRELGLIKERIAEGKLSVHGFIEAADAEVLTGLDPGLFTNINTPEEWNRLLGIAGQDF